MNSILSKACLPGTSPDLVSLHWSVLLLDMALSAICSSTTDCTVKSRPSSVLSRFHHCIRTTSQFSGQAPRPLKIREWMYSPHSFRA